MPLSAYANAARGGSVIDRIANPPSINLLGSMEGAARTAGTIYDLRAKQANEAAGQAYQASINPLTGEFDPQEFRRQLASRPNAAMAASHELANTQNIANAEQDRQKVALGWYNGALGALDDNAGRDKILSTIQSGVRAGILDPATAARETATVNATPDAELPGYMQQHRLTAANAMDQFHAKYGTRQAVSAGGSTEIVTVPPPGPNQPNVSVTTTPTPGERYALTPKHYIHVDKDGKPTPPDQPGTWQEVTTTRQGLGDMPPPGPAPVTTTRPGTPPAPPNAPLPTGYRGRPTTGAPPAPAQPPSAAPAPAASPTAPAAAPPPSQPPATPGTVAMPGGPAILTAPPQGQPERIAADTAAYTAATAAVPDQKKNIVAGESALEALKLASSGPGTSTVNAWKSFMVAQGIPGWEGLDTGSLEAYQNARKNLLRFAQNNGSRVGTDLGLATQLESNPNLDQLLAGTNRHILIQDIGIARQRLAQTLTAPAGGVGKTDFGDGMTDHVRNFTPKTDYHAFSWDLMDPGERSAYLAELQKKGNEKKLEMWRKSMTIARDSGVWSSPPTQ